VEGGVVRLLLRPSRGPQKDEVVGEAIIDTADLPALIENGRRWYLHSDGYAWYAQNVNGKAKGIMLHRFLMNPGPGLVVDHLNRNPLDNRRVNLRVCTHSENVHNTGARVTNKLGVKGVSPHGGAYRVSLQYNGRQEFSRICRTLNIARITASLARLQYQGREYAA
jgi:hypothetical protein